MENIEKNDIRTEFLKRSTAILEHTKIDFKKFQSARMILLAFTQDHTPDYQLWQNLIEVFENIISLEEKFSIKEEDKLSKVVDELGRISIPQEFRNRLRYTI